MQLTIDSSEPLDRVLQVVGSLYGVQLSVAADTQPANEAPASSTRRPAAPRPRRATKPAAPAKAKGQKSRRAHRIDPAVVRSWARANGRAVSDRGRVPAAVVAAYQESIRSGS